VTLQTNLLYKISSNLLIRSFVACYLIIISSEMKVKDRSTVVLNDQHINLCYLLPLLVERALFISRSINISWTLVRYKGQCLHGDIFPWIVHCIMSLHKLGHCVDSRFVVFFRIQHGYNSGGRWVGTSGSFHISTKKTLDFRNDAFQGFLNIICESKSPF